MARKIISLLLSLTIIMGSFNLSYASNERKNLSRKEIEQRIEVIAKKRGIPPVLLKSVARVESVFKQYTPSGKVYTGSRGSIGIMQVNPRSSGFDVERLKYDIDYNIEAGAEMMLRKWDMALRSLPDIGEMDPNVLENWYFALWAYNGWHWSNNPNQLPAKVGGRTKKYAYQDLVYKIAEKEYGQEITEISKSKLPSKGLPSKHTHFNNPKVVHSGNIDTYKKGDMVKVDAKRTLRFRKSPGGKEIEQLPNGRNLYVISEPILKNGYYWYGVRDSETSKEGYVVGNWVDKVGNVSGGEVAYRDINVSRYRNQIINLYNRKIVTDTLDGNFHPDKKITRKEFSIMLYKVLGIDAESYDWTYQDKEELDEYSKKAIMAVSKKGYMTNTDSKLFIPEYGITKEEMAAIIVNIFEIDELLNMKMPSDEDSVSIERYSDVGKVYTMGIMKADSNNNFKPKKFVTREEACGIISFILEKTELYGK